MFLLSTEHAHLPADPSLPFIYFTAVILKAISNKFLFFPLEDSGLGSLVEPMVWFYEKNIRLPPGM